MVESCAIVLSTRQGPAFHRIAVPPMGDPMPACRMGSEVPAGSVVVLDGPNDSPFRLLSLMGGAIESACAAIAVPIGWTRRTVIICWSRDPRYVPGATFDYLS